MVAIDDIGLAAGPGWPGADPGPLASASWAAWGVTATVTVSSPAALRPARRLVARQITEAEAAAGRHRRNAEIHKLYRAGGRAITISPLLADLVSAALITAERTGGDVDPTVSAAVTALSVAPVRTLNRFGPIPVCEHRTPPRPVPGWEQVQLVGRRLQVPAGVTLDLTATAKAVAVDRAAARVADRLGVGVLVQLGSDVASAGPAPDGGWPVRVTGRHGQVQTVIMLPSGAAISTSYVTSRTAPGVDGHRVPGVHMVDPRTGLPATPIHQQVSVLAFSCLEAAAYAAAALVRGATARSWLTQLWAPARLVTVDGDVITAGPWAAHQATPDSRPDCSPDCSPDCPGSIGPTVPGPRLANP